MLRRAHSGGLHVAVATLMPAVLAASLLAADALGHGSDIFVRSEPAAGAVVKPPLARVVVRFRAELDTRRSRLQIFDARQRQVDDGRGGVDLHDPNHASLVVRLPALSPGAYVARWRAVVLEDGDAVEGQFTFTIG
jgi:methionine-rich copper-binding protein CopC